jgi:hypothetical protein
MQSNLKWWILKDCILLLPLFYIPINLIAVKWEVTWKWTHAIYHRFQFYFPTLCFYGGICRCSLWDNLKTPSCMHTTHRTCIHIRVMCNKWMTVCQPKYYYYYCIMFLIQEFGSFRRIWKLMSGSLGRIYDVRYCQRWSIWYEDVTYHATSMGTVDNRQRRKYR